MKYTWTSFEWKDYVNIKANKIHNLPTGVSVSTMCASCNLGTDINLKNLTVKKDKLNNIVGTYLNENKIEQKIVQDIINGIIEKLPQK